MHTNTRYVQNVSRSELYFPREKKAMNETLIFFKIVLYKFNMLISASLLVVKTSLKISFLIWCKAVQSYFLKYPSYLQI